MFLTVTVRDDRGESLGVLVLKEKEFKSGRLGWFGVGKVTIEGARYQCQGQVVAISEPEVNGPVANVDKGGQE